MILCSGDCISPSELSTTTHGKHMIEILNALKVDAGVLGNHEFDFGVKSLQDIIHKMTFPWLCSNVTGRWHKRNFKK